MEKDVRVFRCIGRKEILITQWAHAFTVEAIYELVQEDQQDGLLCLIGEPKNDRPPSSWWVDASQFEEVKIDHLIK